MSSKETIIYIQSSIPCRVLISTRDSSGHQTTPWLNTVITDRRRFLCFRWIVGFFSLPPVESLTSSSEAASAIDSTPCERTCVEFFSHYGKSPPPRVNTAIWLKWMIIQQASGEAPYPFVGKLHLSVGTPGCVPVMSSVMGLTFPSGESSCW